jgi:hypothetical protein
LVIMLRSQGLPARMVVGYRGSEYNELRSFYQIRQRNAHAWVEMYLRPDQVPGYETPAGPVGPNGAWLRLDPTPGLDEAARGRNYWTGTARDWIDYLDSIWGDYVVSLSQKRQQQTLYSPFQSADDRSSAQTWQNWQASFRQVASWLGIHIGDSGSSWKVAFDWRASLTAMALSVLGLMLWRLVRWAIGAIDWSPFFFWRTTPGRRSPVAFYNRLEDILAHRGRTRRPAETPLEYIENAVQELSLLHGDALRRLVLLFYRVRFGGATLEPGEAESIEQALAELERVPTREQV